VCVWFCVVVSRGNKMVCVCVWFRVVVSRGNKMVCVDVCEYCVVVSKEN
jgi:hypothetical protein